MSDPSTPDPSTPDDPAPVYAVRDLTRVYPGSRTVVAVDNVSLTVRRGQRLGIVGESGSGKSTLIRMLAALDRPTAGDIRLHGRSIIGVPERRLGFLRSAVQLVFQDPRSSLDPRMRVGDIITEPLRSRMMRHRSDVPDDHAARLTEVLEAVGLPADSARRFPHEFSGGQRQRIAIARALAPRPEVLIADEPVSALDVSVRAQVLNLLNDLVDRMGLTMIFVSHDLLVVRHVCDSVAVMRGGRIVEAGTTEQVYQRPQEPYTQALLAAIPTIRFER
ncbi:ABC transporter ATP-binding protein [Granulicoccus phenolivorans]|uniref:ABC transporter ATP-binding protein n=1 Tax=Granulicoccus phenolivorans TaxID=266854 RepID=UPI0003F7C442|nr:ATP-binding cassette domain-containing protein [Granulicoccus phenolivorans]